MLGTYSIIALGRLLHLASGTSREEQFDFLVPLGRIGKLPTLAATIWIGAGMVVAWQSRASSTECVLDLRQR